MFFQNRRRWVAVLVCGLVAAGSLADGSARGGEFDDLNARFQRMQQKSRQSARAGQVSRFSAVEGQGLKVWFEKIKPGTTEGTDEFVNLVKYDWKPKERFYIWFETTAPLEVQIWQQYPDEPGKADRMVMPDSRFPESMEPIKAGKYRYPIPFQMDDDPKNEHMYVITEFAGEVDEDDDLDELEDGDTSFEKEDGPGGSIGSREARGQKIMKLAETNSAFRRKTRFNEVAARNEPDDPAVSTDKDEVAALMLGQNPVCRAQIELKKNP